jgi:hypothetical protein
MVRRLFLILLLASVAVLSGRPLLVCTMTAAVAQEPEPSAKAEAHPCHGCKHPESKTPAMPANCMIQIDSPSALPALDQGLSTGMVLALTDYLAPVLVLAPRVVAPSLVGAVVFESPPASIQILRI